MKRKNSREESLRWYMYVSNNIHPKTPWKHEVEKKWRWDWGCVVLNSIFKFKTLSSLQVKNIFTKPNPSRLFSPFFILYHDTMQFAPYLMTGYPSPQEYMSLIDMLIEEWVTMIEAWIPFSDPAADGPTLTALNHEMVQQWATLPSSLELLREVKKKYPELQICLMTYLNPVLKMWVASFHSDVIECGIEYTLFPDLPVEEVHMRHALQPNVSVISDNLSDEKIQEISQATSWFLYLLSFIGTTGSETSWHRSLEIFAKRVRLLVWEEKKIFIWFGIKTVEDVAFIKSLPVDGYIIWSQIVREIQKGGVEGVKKYIRSIQ